MDLSMLNSEQHQGVVTSSKYTRIIAGAGSGKTRVLTYRIAYLIENGLASSHGIMGITFTNKAAQEIKTRVLKLVDNADRMSLCTIHSWCARFLRVECRHISYPSSFTILDEDDTRVVMKEIFASKERPKNDPLITQCLNWIASKKLEGLQYKDIKDEVYPNSEIRFFLECFKEYTEKLESMFALDFDDLLLKTIEVLENEGNGVAKKYRRKISHILVDEFQDINDIQFRLITLLMDYDTELYVVGDPDQTIYTWRGANNDIIMNFEKTLKSIYPDAQVETIVLNKNYRSTKKILEAANKLITNNFDRVKKDLVSLQDEGHNITFFDAAKSSDEASFVVNTIKELHHDKVDYKQIAILYRANYLTREIESQCNFHGVPYRIYGGMKFFQRKEIKDVIAYLTLLINPASDVAFERIINVPKRNIGETSLDKIREAANNNGQRIYHYLQEEEDLPIKGSKKVAVKQLIKILEKTRDEINAVCDVQQIPDILETFLLDVDYQRELDDDKEHGEERTENVNELFFSMRQYFNTQEDASFEGFIENCILQSSQDEVLDGDFVSLMTVHTAKGLEFDYVFVYGLNEGVFPSRRAVEESIKGIEEERRLAYVAFTRAKKKLYLSCNKDYSHMTSSYLTVSRFVKEAGLYRARENISRFVTQNTWKKTENNVIKKTTYNATAVTNGIKDWKVGDLINHDAFGKGTVVAVTPGLITIKFDDEKYGTKKMISDHYMIKKLTN